jgi:hypothetical protein
VGVNLVTFSRHHIVASSAVCGERAKASRDPDAMRMQESQAIVT